MSSSNASSSKYSSVSASSFLDLKGELSKQEASFKKSSSTSLSTTDKYTVGRPRKTSSTPSIFTKQNKGLNSRNEKDRIQWEEDPVRGGSQNPELLKAQLSRKALLYDKIRKGKVGDLNGGQRDNLLVDFERKDWDATTDSEESESESEEEETTNGEILVEYTDDFGRTRLVPQKELPTIIRIEGDEPPDERNIRYGDQHSFPVYAPDPTLLAARAAKYAAEKAEPLLAHYDASRENRSKAAGFYAFSNDEEIRKGQMEGLKREREETERKREGKGGEGSFTGGNVVLSEREKGLIERKRKVEEKRKELEAKRQKT